MNYLFYVGAISPKGCEHVQAIIARDYAAGHRNMTLVLSTHGGDISASLALYHYLKALPFEVHTHASGVVGSGGVTVLMAGAQRTASRFVEIEVHAATVADGPMQGQISPRTSLLAEPFIEIGWSEDDIAQRFTPAGFKMDAAQALELGIINATVDLRMTDTDTWTTINVPAG